MAKPQDEKRSSRRVRTKTAASVKEIDGQAQDLQAPMRDISVRGVFIYLQKKVSEGSSLEIILPLPEGIMPGAGTWIRCKCRVVRVEESPDSKDFGVAAMIEDYEPLSEAAIAQA